MSRKIAILGVGKVGATVAYTLAVKEMASEIVLVDINRDLAEGAAMDIIHGTSFSKPINIYAGDYEDAAGANLVIVALGVGRKPGQSRLELAAINTRIIAEVAPKIAAFCPNSPYIIVSNPVDVLTYAFIHYSGLDPKQVVGSGTMLDTARLRTLLSRRLEISSRNVHAYVFGEHGDSSVFPWSVTGITGLNIRDWCKEIRGMDQEGTDLFLLSLEKEVREAGGEIIRRQGATYYAVSIAVAAIADSMFSDNDAVLTVSCMAHGRYGIDDACLSLPCVLGPQGMKRELNPPLLPEELAAVQESGRILRKTLESVGL